MKIAHAFSRNKVRHGEPAARFQHLTRFVQRFYLNFIKDAVKEPVNQELPGGRLRPVPNERSLFRFTNGNMKLRGMTGGQLQLKSLILNCKTLNQHLYSLLPR